ncbi:DUF7305 domain-containing protein [Dehalogenimonas etheniformans]|uniref:DUF7305 domain-containing protein n=1 Tax=Dehalogenimonas etheniformans TaxID=1536648 RepID=A0A2P5P8J3_9CHLR|nr:hypothetical protein [Dehalogenimonas etheniformans]PPD58614.1 hypothetical protein JP09_001670 [Dehalogenimonas etheniformans]QNT76619.1 hypothetical protein HX448_07950 [Dehalogenimonas etheniformans]
MKTYNKLFKRQAGMAMILALVMLALGGLILGPLLGLVVTSLNVGKHTEIAVEDYFAADSGVEKALWYINQDPLTFTADYGLDLYDYIPQHLDSPATNMTVTDMNGNSVAVTISKTQESMYRVEALASSGARVVSYIAGGGLYLWDGALVSSSDITLKKDTYINGPVYCMGNFDSQGALTHVGPTYEYQTGLIFPSALQNVIFAAHYEALARAGTVYPGSLKITASGYYGSMFINGDFSTSMNLTSVYFGLPGPDGLPRTADDLPATIYVTGSIDIGKDTVFEGNANFVAVGNIGFEKVVNFGKSESIIFSINGSIDFRKEAGEVGVPMEAFIYAPNGNISFKKDATVQGSVVSGQGIDVPMDLAADKNFSITYDPAYRDIMDLPELTLSSVRTWTISH